MNFGKQIEHKEDELRKEKYKLLPRELKYDGVQIRYAPYFFKKVIDYIELNEIPCRILFSDLANYFMYGSLRKWTKEQILELSHIDDPDELARQYWIRYFKKCVSLNVLACIKGDMVSIKNCDPIKHEKRYDFIMETFKITKAFIDSNFEVGKYFECPEMSDETLIQQKTFVIRPNDYSINISNKEIRDCKKNKELKYSITDFFADVKRY